MANLQGAPALGVAASEVFVKQNPATPNIVCICLDDMPHWMLDVAMPKTLLRVRDEGIRFTDAYCTAPICGPDRAVMFSGRYVHTHDCKTNAECAPKFRKLGWEADNIAVRLARTRYTTGLLGKWINAYEDFAPDVVSGFNRFASFAGESIQANQDEYTMSVDGRLRTFKTAEMPETEKLADLVDLFLTNRDNERPYFLWIAPTSPHAPYSPTPANATKFSGWTLRKEANFDTVHSSQPAEIRNLPALTGPETTAGTQMANMLEEQKGKLRECADADDLVERVCQKITERGRWRDTILMFFADNGFHFGEHRLESGKNEPYEESARTPLLMRGAGITKGITNSSLVGTIDIPRTIAALTGASSSGMEGRDLTPLMYATQASVRSRMLVENPHQGWAMLREGSWKFVDRYATAEEELYDFSANRNEIVSVHADPANATLLSGMRASLGALKTCTGAACRTADA